MLSTVASPVASAYALSPLVILVLDAFRPAQDRAIDLWSCSADTDSGFADTDSGSGRAVLILTIVW